MKHSVVLLVFAAALVAGCANQDIQRKDGSTTSRPFSLSNLAKSDVDMISELTQREALRSIRLLAEKLYRRNPQEFRKVGLDSPESAAARIFEHLDKGKESPLALMNWQDNFGLAFQEGYNGDRVYAFMSAMTAMTLAAYDFKTAFYMTDSLNPQKLYNSARNIEVAVWKLSNAKLANGNRALVSNSLEGDVQNLSFEREFGKLIATQDLLALIIEDRTSRSINRVVQGLVFLPI
ncbi:MAG TPA: hypothetical protein PLW81_13865 [Thiobacillaceae bacterium]|nr:hypothetical protein [Thiobacillaceae bacterium]